MQDLRFSQHYFWGFKSSGLWCCIAEWVIPIGSKECTSVLIFEGQAVDKNYRTWGGFICNRYRFTIKWLVRCCANQVGLCIITHVFLSLFQIHHHLPTPSTLNSSKRAVSWWRWSAFHQTSNNSPHLRHRCTPRPLPPSPQLALSFPASHLLAIPYDLSPCHHVLGVLCGPYDPWKRRHYILSNHH